MRIAMYFSLIMTSFNLVAHPSTISLPQKEQDRIGLKTVALTQQTYVETIRAYGVVLDPQLLIQARSKWIQAEAQWKRAEDALFFSEINYLRQKELFEGDQRASQKTFQAAESLFKSNQIDKEAALALLNNLQSEIQAQWGPCIAGWLIKESVEFTNLICQKQFIVQVTLPPSQLISSMPQKAFIEPYPRIVEEIAFISNAPTINNQIQNLSFYYLADSASDHPLMAGMNVQATIPTQTQMNGVEVPASAIVWWQGKAWVYVQTQEGAFTIRQISNQYPTKQGLFVQNELSAGDRVVTVGAQELLSSELMPKKGEKQEEET